MSIFDIKTLAEKIGCDVKSIGKTLYKNTECGIVFSEIDSGISVCGYAEGSDAECIPITLLYPFSSEKFWDAVQQADDEGIELWNEWNQTCDFCPADEGGLLHVIEPIDKNGRPTTKENATGHACEYCGRIPNQ